LSFPGCVSGLHCVKCGERYARGLDGPCAACGPEGVLEIEFDLARARHTLTPRTLRSRRLIRGAVPLTIEGVVRGCAWTPPGSSRPIYVSVGHRIALETALHLVQRTTKRHVPEPLRIADRISKERKREKWEKGGRQ